MVQTIYVALNTRDKTPNSNHSFDCTLNLPAPITGKIYSLSLVSAEVPIAYFTKNWL
jgi:hypothetical protein